MSNSEPARISVKIMDKEYFVACQPDERSDLLDSADYLNKQMKLIRDGGKVLGADRVAVMAALNIANELLRLRARGTGSQSEIGTRLKSMRERAETALQRGQQLEL